MKRYLLPETGNFYKANLHCHTNYSDGKKTPEEVKEIYKARGYSVVAFTDHDILIPHPELADDTFLPLNGVEVYCDRYIPGVPWEESKNCHINFIGLEPDNITQPCWHRTKYLYANAVNHRDEVKFDENEPDFERDYSPECITKMMQTAREKGFFVIYNHPVWSKEVYTDYIQFRGMHALEIMNGSNIVGGFDDYNPRVYDEFLEIGLPLYCVGGDDNHNSQPETSRRFDSGWAFTVIKAEKLEYRTVTRALEQGHFYASEGPEIYELWIEDGVVHLGCSAADRIFATFGTRRSAQALAENGVPVTELEFSVLPNDRYFRVTVVDEHGKHACTNAYFVKDIL